MPAAFFLPAPKSSGESSATSTITPGEAQVERPDALREQLLRPVQLVSHAQRILPAFFRQLHGDAAVE